MKKLFAFVILLITLISLSSCFNDTTKTWPTEEVNKFVLFDFPSYEGEARFELRLDPFVLLRKEFTMLISKTNKNQYDAYINKLLSLGYVEKEDVYESDYELDYISLKDVYEKTLEDGSFVSMNIHYDDYGDNDIHCYIYVEYEPATGPYENWPEFDMSMFADSEKLIYNGGTTYDYHNQTEETRKSIKQLLNYSYVANIFMGHNLTEEEREALSKMQGTRKLVDSVYDMYIAVFNTNQEELLEYTSKFDDWEVVVENECYAKTVGDMTTIVSLWYLYPDNPKSVQIYIEKYPNEYYEYFYKE